ncbi:hypothetical protein [Streptomyces sp. NBC_00009]|uniref:hypothetical protein n=1 Tax=Streptomyces sp. NBC_00009 TaxID=2975620 RepID=UPI00324A4FC5
MDRRRRFPHRDQVPRGPGPWPPRARPTRSTSRLCSRCTGINEADLTAYFLDRKRGEPILKKQAAAGAIGAAAIRRGFGVNTLDFEGYATLGITADQAEQAYAQIAEGFESMLGIAGRYGTTWSQREAEQEVFTPGAARTVGGQSAAEKGRRLKSRERALFSGGRGSSTQGLNAGYFQT